MPDSYYLKVMGSPELLRSDGRPIKLKVRKHLALLIRLAVDARPVYRRDELVDLLWPGVADHNGRHSLSMGLSVLRGLFGPDSVRGNHVEVRFSAPSLTLDLEQLQRGETLGSDTDPPVEVDGFLGDFEIEDAPAFQHWRDRRNAELLPAIQAGLLTLTAQARRSGDVTRLMVLAERLLALDPLSEEGIRARMEAFALQADRLSALRVFEDWKRELTNQLGARPSELLEAMATRLRRRGLDLAPAPSGTQAPVERAGEQRFVGRTAEYRVLFDAWESTTQLNTRHILLSGESGIGKSTLAMRFGAAAALAGAAVARVQCFELEQRIAFGMIGTLVTILLDRPGVVATAPESLAEVARIVPKVRERFPHLPPPRPTEGEAARLHFAEGTFAVFDAIMEEQPLVLIVDDYPRADEASLSVLHMLLRRAQSNRLMVVLSGRPPEPDEPPQAARIRKGVSYLPLHRVDLPPLTEAESDDLLRAILASAERTAGSPERRAILRTAGGNPMALELLTQDWIAHPDAPLAILLTAMRADVPGAAFEAIGYDRLIERMLPTLPPRTRVALHLAAILGPRLNDLEYFSILDLTPSKTMAALSEMVERRVLRNTGCGLEFTNELVRARLYLKIPVAVRVRLHSGVADRLLAAVGRGEPIPGLEVAWHCIRGRRKEEATPYLMRGARNAITHGAPDEAARALSSALGQLKGKTRARAILTLAETYQEMGKWEDALAYLEQLDASDRCDSFVRENAEAMEIESRRQLGHHAACELCSVGQDLLGRIRAWSVPSARVRAALSAASLTSYLNDDDFTRALSHALDGIQWGELDNLMRGKILLARAMAYYNVRDGDNGLEAVSTAAHLLADAGATDTTYVSIHIGLGAIATANGDYESAIPYLEAAYNTALRLDNVPFMSVAAGNLAVCFHRLGHQKSHKYWAETAWLRAQCSQPGTFERVHSTAECCDAALSLGEKSLALSCFRRLEQEACAATFDWVRQAGLLFQADIASLLGNQAEALRAVRAARDISQQALRIGFKGKFARWSTMLLLRAGQPEQAWKELSGCFEEIDRLDAADTAEILVSAALIGRIIPLPMGDLTDRARAMLATLPASIGQRLERLGLVLNH